MPSNLLGIIFALTSAALWGGGDFSGGLAARKSNQFQVLMLAALTGTVLLLVCALGWGEGLPTSMSALWAALAGAAGALGVASLYRALSLGHTASVAPTSAIITAALPVLFGSLTAGLPKTTQMAGFGLAFMGIWLISRPPETEKSTFREGMVLAFLSGIGFGMFFIFIAQVEKGYVFGPILIARMVTLLIAMLMLKLRRIPLPALTSNPLAILAGVLDTGGNVFYLLATQYTRLDVAAVLAALYPAGTVILAAIVMKEKISMAQWTGAGLCLAAIGLITL